jgi:hypothetical protein
VGDCFHDLQACILRKQALIAILDFFHQVLSQFLFPINSRPFEMISILHRLSKSSGKPQGAQMVAGLW